MSNPDLRARVETLTKVATMPRTVTTVAAMIDDGSASAFSIAREVGKDQVLTLKLLRLVNSGFCGFRSPVTSISHATVLVGLDALRMLMFGTTLLTLDATERMKGFWQHSLGTARVAGILAERACLAKPEELAVAGLLHDIGKVVITQVSPDAAVAIDDCVEKTGGLRIDAEREILGVTHPEVGGWLAERWSLPERLTYQDGALALENEEIDDAFLAKGVRLAVDGLAPDEVHGALMSEMRSLKERHRQGYRIFRFMGSTAPAMGMIGTLIGLVQMLQTMDDPASIGPSMAVALLTTLYGALFAFLVFIPMADKLECRTKDEARNMSVVIMGVDSLLKGENPRFMRDKLDSFLEPKQRESKEEPE